MGLKSVIIFGALKIKILDDEYLKLANLYHLEKSMQKDCRLANLSQLMKR